jgi:hypothetical protein
MCFDKRLVCLKHQRVGDYQGAHRRLLVNRRLFIWMENFLKLRLTHENGYQSHFEISEQVPITNMIHGGVDD